MSTSRMFAEAAEAPAAVARLLAAERETFEALGADLRQRPPLSLLTVARGSSDHAAHYMAYLVMARLGRLVTSLPMSLVTLYQSRLVCDGLVALAFSQSGQSPDLVAPLRYFGDHGARTVAFVNDAASPLALAAHRAVPLHAGPETSVAATKSYVTQLVAGAALAAAWRPEDADFSAALDTLPAALDAAWALDWAPAIDALRSAERLYVIGRGMGLPVAMEAALKFKEVCGIQAEAYSGAEVQHGPMALVGDGFPILVLAPRGPAQAGLRALAAQMRNRGAHVLLAAPPGTGADLPLASAGHEDLDPIVMVQGFYRMVEALALARGLDPDKPRHLAKVTRTR